LAAVAALGTAFPWGTLAVNAIGSAAIGALAALGLQHHARLLLVTGLLGGFTTFSALAVDTVQLSRGGATGLAITYAVGTLVLGAVATGLGIAVGRTRPADSE
jgi:CrcB protein